MLFFVYSTLDYSTMCQISDNSTFQCYRCNMQLLSPLSRMHRSVPALANRALAWHGPVVWYASSFLLHITDRSLGTALPMHAASFLECALCLTTELHCLAAYFIPWSKHTALLSSDTSLDELSGRSGSEASVGVYIFCASCSGLA